MSIGAEKLLYESRQGRPGNSPAIYGWVTRREIKESPVGTTERACSIVPTGLNHFAASVSQR
jgi:hypothetical protein